MIEFTDVTLRYGTQGIALERIDLFFEAGEFAFITGPSGAGKSSLLKLLYAAERPTVGDVTIEGRSVGRLHPRSVPFLRRNLGIIFQDFKLLPRRTVLENVCLPLEVCGLKRSDVLDRSKSALRKVGLAKAFDRLPGELSGGEQQRAAIARAVANKPSIILADEPTGNLDEALSHEIFELLVGLQTSEGATILAATHDLAEVARWPLRHIKLRDGRVEQDTPASNGPLPAGGPAIPFDTQADA
jgi:cell division transport system ATP-binding protein